jgi:HEAT repeat protein
MSEDAGRQERPGTGVAGPEDEKGDWRVVLQFFLVPLALVAVLVTVFFGLQVLRSRSPDPRATLDDLKGKGGFLLPWVGDPKRWQSGYDLSLLLRSRDGRPAPLPELAEAFREARRTDDIKLRRYLALALGRAGDDRAAVALGEGLDDPDGDTRLYCAWGLMQIGGGAALADLRRVAATHGDSAVRKMAVFGLGQRGDRAAAAVLRRALSDPDQDVRWNAAISLARLGDASGEAILIAILETPAARDAPPSATAPADAAAPALNAIRGLALLGDARARAALERATRAGASGEIRATARLAIESMGAEARRSSP